MATPSRNWQKAGLHILFFFRFIQLGSVAITGFIYCYLTWHHNNHYCAFYPRNCTAEGLSQVRVPWEYKVTIAACTLAFLESYIYTTSFLHRQAMPNHRVLLCSMLPVTTLIGFACGAIFRNPATSAFCWFLQIPGSLRSNVEEKNCVIVVDGYVSLSIATGFTAFIFLMSAIVVVYTHMKRERIMLPLAIEEKDGLPVGTIEGAGARAAEGLP
jgi:hypothetical protein